jgi:uncharacterized protein YndB with AHSA1/START domain
MLDPGQTTTTVDRATHTIRFDRTFSSSRERLFDAWTQPEHVRHWWDPTGAPLTACTIDLRPGGAFAFTNAGHSPPFTGTYQAIERPSRLVFEAMGSVGTVRFEELGRTTRMTVSIRCASAEHLEAFVKLGVVEGTARTIDNLARHLRQPAALQQGAPGSATRPT